MNLQNKKQKIISRLVSIPVFEVGIFQLKSHNFQWDNLKNEEIFFVVSEVEMIISEYVV